MEVKLFEVRDEGTCIPVMASKVTGCCEAELWLLSRAGFQGGHHVILQALHKGPSTYNAYDWANGSDGCRKSRTMHETHLFIKEHWAELISGDVIDVQFILGETTVKKESERVAHG